MLRHAKNAALRRVASAKDDGRGPPSLCAARFIKTSITVFAAISQARLDAVINFTHTHARKRLAGRRGWGCGWRRVGGSDRVGH